MARIGPSNRAGIVPPRLDSPGRWLLVRRPERGDLEVFDVAAPMRAAARAWRYGRRTEFGECGIAAIAQTIEIAIALIELERARTLPQKKTPAEAGRLRGGNSPSKELSDGQNSIPSAAPAA